MFKHVKRWWTGTAVWYLKPKYWSIALLPREEYGFGFDESWYDGPILSWRCGFFEVMHYVH